MDFSKITTEKLAAILCTQGITSPTPVQLAAIPIISAKKDIIAQSATGTGKTLAYLLPIFAAFDTEIKSPQAIVLAPTYELAGQIAKVAQGLADTPSDVALIIGGANKTRQQEALKTKPKLVVGSLGRILGHMSEKKLSVHNVKSLVFDEGDRLFVSENMDGLNKLKKAVLRDTQMLLFSASTPENVVKMAVPFMKSPEILQLDDKLPKNIQHFYIISEAREKFDNLRKLARAIATQVIVFVNMPFTIEKVASRLVFHKLTAMPLYGAAEKSRRKQAMDAFHQGRIQMLVASDVGSRGLDVDELSCVINLDLPESEKDYLHRAGRCGRMGRHGIVISIVTPREVANLEKIAKKLDISVAKKIITRGKLEGVL